jgi:putative two-component system response regulator
LKEGHVLVVDDEAMNRTLVRRVLEPQGYSVTEASDGEEALTSVAKNAPDVVLLDLQMPRLDGYGVLKRLKQDAKTRLIPVIMLTSLDQLSSKVKAVEVGADDYLTKPFNVEELSARVKSLVSLKRYTDELEHASQVLHSIAVVVEERDAYTGDHCARVGLLATLTAQSLGLGQEELRLLSLGGSYHDLGKIAIPDGILRKPGKLTPEEFETMKRHAALGADILKPMRTMARVIDLVRHHHEKLDGSGYPDRLPGRDIPATVRILSVTDIYDALATKRPYKDALPHETCMKILRDEAAKGWWDREVVEALGGVVIQQGLAER